jgi:hypothetical protein
MTRERFCTLILTLAIVATSTACSKHTYFSEGTEFTYRFTDANNAPIGAIWPDPRIPLIVQVKYLSKDIAGSRPYAETALYFEMVDKGSQLNLLMPSVIADRIELDSGIVYRIVAQVVHGWPTAYGLIISQGWEVIFIGIADSQAFPNITIDDEFLPISNLPMKVEKTRVLTNHYVDGDADTFFSRKTNTEITFSLDGKSVAMHQGELSLIGDYKISLLIAREVQYKRNVYDAGVNEISYTVNRIGESKPLTTAN